MDAPSTGEGGTDGEVLFKICMIGSRDVGKTALVSRYLDNTFLTHPDPTIAVAFYTKKVMWRGKTATLHIWDTAGQEKYSSIAPLYCRKANAVLLCYDTRDRQSFTDIEYWIEKAKVPTMAELVLVGTKTDLPQLCTVSAEEARAKAATLRTEGVRHFETSSKSGVNVDDVFDYLVATLLSSWQAAHPDPDVVHLQPGGAQDGHDQNNRRWTCCS